MRNVLYFEYGKKEIDYLSSRDKRIASAIEKIGFIQREVDSDLFTAVCHQIIAQQISTKVQAAIFEKFKNKFNLAPHIMANVDIIELGEIGISKRKASYIIEFAKKIDMGVFDTEKVCKMTDDDVIYQLCMLKGVGRWTAQMVLLFCLQRPDVFSFEDLAVKRGLCLLYQKESISQEDFFRYKSLFSPYCSVASLYLWEIANKKYDIATNQTP